MSELTPTALVTGGSRGIGKCVAETLAAQGFQVYLTYVSKPDEAAAVVSGIEAAGGKARAFCLNVADSAAVGAFFLEHVKDKIHLSLLVNNAGVTRDNFIVRMKDEDWSAVIDVT